MSFLLWVDEAKDDAVDLGDPFELFRAFAELARAAGDKGGDYEDLFSVPQFGEQRVDAEWLSAVAAQAENFLAGYEGLSDQARWILGRLAARGEQRPAAETPT